MTTFLMVMAHPDDEILWGWPIFQNKAIRKKLLMCSSDLYNKERSWCNGRKYPLIEICKKYNVELRCLDNSSGFYRSESRHGTLSGVCTDIANNLRDMEGDVDYVFTHNPHGEYGHLDHKLLFDIVVNSATKPIYYTDIALVSNWPSTSEISQRARRLYYGHRISQCVIDKEEYTDCEMYYRNADVWTWNHPIKEQCCLYKLG